MVQDKWDSGDNLDGFMNPPRIMIYIFRDGVCTGRNVAYRSSLSGRKATVNIGPYLTISGEYTFITYASSMTNVTLNTQGKIAKSPASYKIEKPNVSLPIRGYSTIAAGFIDSAVVKTGNNLWSWGVAQPSGNIVRTAPEREETGVVSASISITHSMILKSDGSVWTWGQNRRSLLGDGTQTDRWEPCKIMDSAAAISVDDHTAMVLKTDGSVWSWGFFSSTPEKITDGVMISAGTPTPNTPPADTAAVAAFVTRLYSNVLDRTPDPAGIDAWVNRLASKEWGGGQAAENFFFGAPYYEFQNRGLNNEQFLRIMYSTFMDRDPDPTGWDAWLNRMNNQGYTWKQVFDGFVESPEWGNRCDAAGIRR